MSARQLFVIRHGPYGNSLGREAVDALLGAAALGSRVLALFLADGVLQWLPNQAPTKGHKNLATMLKALPLYDIEEVYLDGTSLQQRGIDPASLPEGLTILNPEEVRRLLAQPGQQLVSF